MAIALSNLINIFATPTDTFANLKEMPKWLPAFVVISVVTLCIAFFTVPLSKQITYIALSESRDVEKEQIEQALVASERFKYIGMAFVPVLLLLRWVVFGAILYFTAILLGGNEVRFKQIYAALVFAEVIFLLRDIINILLLYIKGIDTIQNITDLQAIVGLDYFLVNKSANIPLFIFLNNINIFTIWYVTTLSISVSVITNFSKLKSSFIVTSVWLLGVGFQVAMAAISTRASAGVG